MGTPQGPRRAKRLSPSPLQPTPLGFHNTFGWVLVILVVAVVLSVSTFFIFGQGSSGALASTPTVIRHALAVTVAETPVAPAATPGPTKVADPVVTATPVATVPPPAPTLAPPEPTPTPEPPAPKTYTVQSGDTLYGIADKLGISFSDLVALNSLGNVHTLRVGQVLVVP